MNPPPDRRLVALSALLEVEKRARAATSAEALGFVLVNDTHLVVPYRQAALLRADSGRIEALSGLATPDPDAPFTRRLAALMKRVAARTDAAAGPRAVDLPSLPEEAGEKPDAETKTFLATHLPARLALVPLARGGEVRALLLLAREEPFGPAELQVLGHLADAYAHAWAALVGARGRRGRVRRRGLAAALAALAALAILALPVRQSVLAPAEVVAEDAALVTAPVDGVVETVHVDPNAAVAAGDLLVTLDGRELSARLEIARQALAVAEAELRQARQQAVFDDRSRARIAILEGRREQNAAEVAFVEETLARIRISAPRDGIAVFDDASDWEGRPVALGERIMQVADPGRRALEIHLAVADAIVLEPGAEVRLFLNIDPADPLPATLLRAGYRATPTPDGVMAYRLRAGFDADDPRLRIGLRGTAKLYGERTILALYLLRRPIAAARLWLGL
ncbi:efflux RND transporter periplasmic adaptor subunit [Salinarimonas rosea]|uniref:efflux RND transporter periplasmic adaptor subunit n=1 Tax=Salinarimonas rosea TaxID=552063 RepID=UPI00040145C1|nr:HlyD family efflux transporter periplasmic adaptor subunit [Salinarimonas rosea]